MIDPSLDAQDEPQQLPPDGQPARVWAEKAGHLPESFPGNRMRPVRVNRQAWIASAACARLRITLDDSIDERTYLDAAAEVLSATAR